MIYVGIALQAPELRVSTSFRGLSKKKHRQTIFGRVTPPTPFTRILALKIVLELRNVMTCAFYAFRTLKRARGHLPLLAQLVATPRVQTINTADEKVMTITSHKLSTDEICTGQEVAQHSKGVAGSHHL